jgi:hypothetical protein
VSRPSSGVRYVVERAEQTESRVRYQGFAHLPDRDLPLSIDIDLPAGATRASLPGGPPELEKAAAALVRSATRAAVAAGSALPRKIVRWRG